MVILIDFSHPKEDTRSNSERTLFASLFNTRNELKISETGKFIEFGSYPNPLNWFFLDPQLTEVKWHGTTWAMFRKQHGGGCSYRQIREDRKYNMCENISCAQRQIWILVFGANFFYCAKSNLPYMSSAFSYTSVRHWMRSGYCAIRKIRSGFTDK